MIWLERGDWRKDDWQRNMKEKYMSKQFINKFGVGWGEEKYDWVLKVNVGSIKILSNDLFVNGNYAEKILVAVYLPIYF